MVALLLVLCLNQDSPERLQARAIIIDTSMADDTAPERKVSVVRSSQVHNRPEGEGWEWNEDEQCWQRVVGTFRLTNAVIVPQPTPIIHPFSQEVMRGQSFNCGPRG